MDFDTKDRGIITKFIGGMKEKIIRVISFEVRPRRIAYAAFETPASLLDWGIRGLEPRLALNAMLTNILKTYHPSVFVLHRAEVGSRRDNPRTNELLRAIEAEANRLALAVAFVTERESEAFFRRHGRVTKYQIAEQIGKWFPELASRVPPLRKPWHPEHDRTVIFDAMATALVYLATERIDLDSS